MTIELNFSLFTDDRSLEESEGEYFYNFGVEMVFVNVQNLEAIRKSLIKFIT